MDLWKIPPVAVRPTEAPSTMGKDARTRPAARTPEKMLFINAMPHRRAKPTNDADLRVLHR